MYMEPFVIGRYLIQNMCLRIYTCLQININIYLYTYIKKYILINNHEYA